MQLICKIPFGGFYVSKWSDLVDSQASQWVEYHAEESHDCSDDSEMRYPEPLRLDAGELAEILFRVTDYAEAYGEIARGYAESFAVEADAALGFSLGLTFESMDSPREYNFATDRLFCHMPEATARALLAFLEKDAYADLRRIVRERFTSRDGFISFYSADVDSDEWLGRDVTEWDHNQLECLLVAALESVGADLDEIEWAIFENWSDSGYAEWQGAVDWDRFEAERDEIRAEKLADWRESDPEKAKDWENTPEYLRPYRCRQTPDLFDWHPGQSPD